MTESILIKGKTAEEVVKNFEKKAKDMGLNLELQYSSADFGKSYIDRTDIWASALNRIFEDLGLPIVAEVEEYVAENRDYLSKWETDRIMITVKRT